MSKLTDEEFYILEKYYSKGYFPGICIIMFRGAVGWRLYNKGTSPDLGVDECLTLAEKVMLLRHKGYPDRVSSSRGRQ